MLHIRGDKLMRLRNPNTKRALRVAAIATGLILLVSWLAWLGMPQTVRPIERAQGQGTAVAPHPGHGVSPTAPNQPSGMPIGTRIAPGSQPGTSSSAPRPTTPQIAILSSSPQETVAEIRFPEPVITPTTYRGRQAVVVSMADCRPLKGVDQPALPVGRWDLVIPTDAQASVEIASIDSYTAPSAPPVPSGGFGRRDQPRPEGDYGSVYLGDTPFPAQIAQLSPTYRIRQLEGTGLIVHPVRYLPAAEALQIVRSVQVRIRYAATAAGATLRYPAAPASRAFRQLAASRYVNYTETVATAAAATRAVGDFTGTDTLLVIAPDAWDGQFGDFLEWKRQRGLQVLSARYPADTGSGTANLASYIQNAYDTHDIAYVLLVGDENAVPVSEGDQDGGTPSDTVYALVAGSDSYHDLFLSRVSVTTASRAATLLDKYLAYERNPDSTDGWRASGMMVASNINNTTSLDTVYKGKTDADDLNLFRSDLLGSGLFGTVNQAYENTTEGTTAKVSSYWNGGRSLIYYLGHGSTTTWVNVTGSFANSDAAALTNGARLPYVVSGACLNGAFQQSSPCLAEAMLWGTSATGQGGALAVIAATNNMSWDPPIAMLDAFTGYYLGQSDFQVGSFLSVSGQTQLWDAGGLAFASIQRAMDYCASASSLGEDELDLIMQQTHLFGDCTIGVRTVTPQPLAVNHGAYVLPSTEGLVVVVTNGDRAAMAGAAVTLVDGDGHQVVGTTDANGEATVPGNTFAPGSTVTLTVYERNSIPYQETALQVGDGTVTIGTSAALPTGFLDESYSHTFAAVMGTEPYTWSLAGGNLPDGMSLDPSTGAFSGTPSAVGTHAFTLRVTDSGNDANEKAFSWKVGQAVQLADQALADGTVGTGYTASLAAAGTFAPFAYSLVAGSLPPGVSFGTDGSLGGAPARQGDYAFTVEVTDSESRTDQAAITVTIHPSANVTIAPVSLANGEVAIPYAARFEASGGSGGGYVWTLLSGSLPGGLTLTTEGLLVGTPTASGTSTFTVQVTDDAAEPHAANAEFSLTIGQPVAFGDPVLPDGIVGIAYSEQLPATGSHAPFSFVGADSETYVQSAAASTYTADGTLQTEWYGDEVHHTLDLGFRFPYFGQEYTSCRVGDNGYLVFGTAAPATGADGDAWNATPDRLDDYRMIAPCWVDLLILPEYADTGIWLQRDGNSITIRWSGRDYDHSDAVVNVSVTLFATGQIICRYGTIQTSNRVVIGLGDANAHPSIVVYSQDKWKTGISAWSGADDLVLTPQGDLPAGLSLSSTGVLSGTPTTAGTFTFLATVADTAGNTDTATFTIEVLPTIDPDGNGDGDVGTDEILAYIEHWYAGNVSETDVENAVALWRQGPRARRTATTGAPEPVTRTRVRVVYGDRATLDRLIDHGLIVTTVRDGIAWIDATAEDWAWIKGLGLPWTADPKPPSREAPTSYATVVSRLQDLANAYPDLCRLVQVGTSVDGRSLLALVISDNPAAEEDEPETRLVGGIHGDERLGMTIAFDFAEWLLQHYGQTDADGIRATALVDDLEIWVLPLLNPDGYEANRRSNSHDVDLNRSFPDGIVDGVGTVYAEGAPDTSGREPETAAFMAWTAAHRFAIGATLHTGAQLVCYPYGNNPAGTSTYSAAPDDDVYIALSHAYADNHATMATSGTFSGGIINSCDWYRVTGELPDWAYRYTGSLEITVELDNADAPPEDPAWLANRESLIAFMGYARRGLRGVVRDAVSGAPLTAAIQIAGNDRAIYTDPEVGDYHRLLLPGVYEVTVTAEGYASQTFPAVAVADGDATRLDVDLVPGTGPPWLVRTFATALYEPAAGNTIALEAHLDSAALPHAFIVAETIPTGWSYAADSAQDAATGAPLDTPRIEGNTVSWLFWRDDVHGQHFTYSAIAPTIRSDTAVFGGALRTVGSSLATTGASQWLARTENRFALTVPVGWSLISIPIDPTVNQTASIFSDADVAVWAWDAAALQYFSPASLCAKEGYWVHSARELVLILEGTVPSDTSRDFAIGWSLFGPLADRDQLDEPFFDRGNLAWSAGQYVRAVRLQCGKGYWIHAATAGRAALR